VNDAPTKYTRGNIKPVSYALKVCIFLAINDGKIREKISEKNLPKFSAVNSNSHF
jgi:hypothetical protein